jgi:AraC family transcriptional regulator
VLATCSDLRVVVHSYAPGEHHRPHTDRCARISFPLRGTYREDAPAGVTTLGPGDLVFKSRKLVHEDWFGEHGTTIASVELCDASSDDQDAIAQLSGQMWIVRRDSAALRLVLDMLDAAAASDLVGVETIVGDLFAAGASASAPARRRAAPPWLRRLKEELEVGGLAATPVATRARQAGVHPVHASRLFRSCFGVTMTAHAQLHGVRRALVLMNDAGAPLSQVAAAAGFYDQSHMNRVFRWVLGRAPGSVRRACALALARVDERSAGS